MYIVMKNKILFLFLMVLLSACTAGQAAPINLAAQATEMGAPVASQSTASSVDSVGNSTDLPATQVVLPTATFTPKPPLEEGAWMHMPAVPTEIRDSMRLVYERGLALGIDP